MWFNELDSFHSCTKKTLNSVFMTPKLWWLFADRIDILDDRVKELIKIMLIE